MEIRESSRQPGEVEHPGFFLMDPGVQVEKSISPPRVWIKINPAWPDVNDVVPSHVATALQEPLLSKGVEQGMKSLKTK